MIVVARLKAKSGEEARMEEALRAMIEKVATEEGTLAYTLHRLQKDPTVFLFYEKYRDKDAFKFHGQTPHMQEMVGAIGPLMDGAPQIEIYEELASLPR